MTEIPVRSGRPTLIGRVLVLVLLAAAVSPFADAQRREPGFGVVTVGPSDGWYTPEQAERGDQSYTQHCARCHGVELDGVIGQYPPLTGERFISNWEGLAVETLFNYVSATMPFDMPAALERDAYIDIIAYILRENGLPPGESELRANRGQLGKLVIPISPPEVEHAEADPEVGPEEGEGAR